MTNSALYTWRDIERILLNVSQPPWIRSRVDLGVVEIICEPGGKSRAEDLLRDLFGTRFSEDEIRLESLAGQPRTLGVRLEETETPELFKTNRVIRPLWPDALLPGVPAAAPERAVRLAAFYSYKGGVGRTTCLLATAAELLQRQVRVLIVDADLEAPGITWNIPGPPDRISLLDAMGLIHDEEKWEEKAIPLIAAYLNRNRESIELPSGRASFDFLPAFRDFDQIFSLPLTFEQLVRARGRSYIVGDALTAIADAIEAEVVLVDLRAGITEFSSPLLLDERVQSILVTSCNQQSVEGTVQTLLRMQHRVRGIRSPEVVISMVPPGEPGPLVNEISEKLITSFPSNEEGLPSSSVYQINFAQELLHYEGLEDLLGKRIPGTDLGKRVARQLADLIFPESETINSQTVPQANLERVFEQAKQLEYAESSDVKGLLPTSSLISLVEHFSTSLPAAVVLGSKGAGKTFAWTQIIRSALWSTFRRLVRGEDKTSFDGLAFPLLGPANVQEKVSLEIRTAEKRVWQSLGVTSGGTMDELRSSLQRLGEGNEQDDDLVFWISAIARRLGLPEGAGRTVEDLSEALQRANSPIVIVSDGFEDAFQISPENPLSEEKRRALRGLLQRLTLQIRDLSSPFLGIVTFIRRDLAEDSIPQNFGQFEALYNRFSLAWSPTEALRLAVWLLDRAGYSVMERERIPRASYDDLRIALQQFWGIKMGTPSSKETYTDRWVIAALSDLQGRLQPRDIVRLIRFATEKVLEKDPNASMLTPQALRGALAQCSERKIEELEQEVRALAPLFERFRKASPEKRAIPFFPEDFNLSDSEVAFLKRQGIVTNLEEGFELYMPEIIRQGLGFKLKEGRRAKVLALYRATQLRNL